MKFIPTRIPDVLLIEPDLFEDSRGFFMETWEARKFAAAGIRSEFVQDNHSVSRQWVLRGLHYQLQKSQGKLVRVTEGEVFDVAVDVRKSSPTFGQWTAERLSAANRLAMWIPPGFAHGFLVLSERATFVYKCTDYYDRDSERTIVWNEPAIAIDWPIPAGVQPLLSNKDNAGSLLADADCFP